MAKLTIHTKGSEILGKKAQAVQDIHDAEFQEFLEDLAEACFEYDGVGIAAPQVGVSQRVFIVASKPNERYPNAPEIEPLAIINPEILSHSEETEVQYEGCLSIPGMRGRVSRPVHISVRFTNLVTAHNLDTYRCYFRPGGVQFRVIAWGLNFMR